MRLRPRTVTVRDWIYVMFYEYVKADKYWYEEEEVLCPLFMAIRESVHFHIFIVRTQEVRDGGRGCVCVCVNTFKWLCASLMTFAASDRTITTTTTIQNKHCVIRHGQSRLRPSPGSRDTQNFTEWLTKLTELSLSCAD